MGILTKRVFRRTTAAAALVAFSVLVSGCDQVKNTERPSGELKQGENGMRYILTCLDGKKFIAYQTYFGYWNLIGPGANCAE